MLTRIIEYYCDKTPQLSDIERSIEIAKRESVIIKLSWFVNYNGWHDRFIKQNDIAEEVYKTLPRVYGL